MLGRCGTIIAIRWLHDQEGKFKGCGFATFATPAEAEAALRLGSPMCCGRPMKLGPSHAKSVITPYTPLARSKDWHGGGGQWDEKWAGGWGGAEQDPSEQLDSRGRPSLGSVIPFYAPASTAADGGTDSSTDQYAHSTDAAGGGGRAGKSTAGSNLASRYETGKKLAAGSAEVLAAAGCSVPTLPSPIC